MPKFIIALEREGAACLRMSLVSTAGGFSRLIDNYEEDLSRGGEEDFFWRNYLLRGISEQCSFVMTACSVKCLRCSHSFLSLLSQHAKSERGADLIWAASLYLIFIQPHFVSSTCEEFIFLGSVLHIWMVKKRINRFYCAGNNQYYECEQMSNE